MLNIANLEKMLPFFMKSIEKRIEMIEEEKYILRVIKRLFGIDIKEVREEIREYDWSFILYQSAIHRIIPIIYYDLIKQELAAEINKKIYKLMRNITKTTKYNNKLLFEQAYLVALEAQKENLNILILKGSILEQFLYSGVGMRIFDDIDILIDRQHLLKIKNLLKNLDYTQGSYDKNQECIIPANRKEIIEREMLTHETVEFHKVIEDYKTDIVIDVNHSLFWKGMELNTKNKMMICDFMKRRAMYGKDEMSIPGPTPEMLFLHTCIHLYSEAAFFCWQYSWSKNFGDSELRKYIDIGLFFSKQVCWNKVYEDIYYYDIEEPISYVLTQFNLLFPEIYVPDQLIGLIDKCSKNGYYYTCSGMKKKWTLSIRKRIFNQSACIEDVAAHTVPGDIIIKQ